MLVSRRYTCSLNFKHVANFFYNLPIFTAETLKILKPPPLLNFGSFVSIKEKKNSLNFSMVLAWISAQALVPL